MSGHGASQPARQPTMAFTFDLGPSQASAVHSSAPLLPSKNTTARHAKKGIYAARPRHDNCAIGNESAPTQLAQCRFPGLAISNAKMYFFQIKYTEAILSNSTQKLLWFELTKMLTAV